MEKIQTESKKSSDYTGHIDNLSSEQSSILEQVKNHLKEKNIKTFKTNLLISLSYFISISFRVLIKSPAMNCIKYIPLGYDDASQMAM